MLEKRKRLVVLCLVSLEMVTLFLCCAAVKTFQVMYCSHSINNYITEKTMLPNALKSVLEL